MWINIILGILQGIFEWLPISSEGIIAITSLALKQPYSPIEVALFLHLGTVFAAIIYFRKDWKNVATLKDRKLLRFLIIATAISLILGFLIFSVIRYMAVGSGGILLIVTGLGLLFTAGFHKSKIKLKLGMDKVAAIAGCLQGLAVLPGFSRSGATIFGISLSNMKPAEILKYSYMLSVPAVAFSAVYLLVTNPMLRQGWLALVVSFVVGILTLHALLKFSQKINFYKFALIFGILCISGGFLSLLI